MPEPITIASGVSAIVTNSIKLCLRISAAIDDWKAAPKHLRVVATDLQRLLSILGTIQQYLDDENLTRGLFHPRKNSCDNVQQSLADVVDTLIKFETLVNDYIKVGRGSTPSTWNRTQWLWKEKDVERLRDHLLQHKLNLNIAIAMASWMLVPSLHLLSYLPLLRAEKTENSQQVGRTNPTHKPLMPA